MQQHDVEHIQRIDRRDARHQRAFPVAIERLQSEAAGIDLAALIHELLQTGVEVEMAVEGRVAELGKTALNAESDARTIEQDRGFKPFVDQTTRLQQIDQADGSFKGHGVKSNQRFFTRFGFDIGEHLLLVVDEEIARLIGRTADSRHEGRKVLLRQQFGLGTRRFSVADATKNGGSGIALNRRFGVDRDGTDAKVRDDESVFRRGIVTEQPGSRRQVVIIGGGQAGLSIAHALKKRGLCPLVLEKHRVAHAWEQQRWDSFCLVTPNWQCRLPDFPYDGPDPEGFMVKAEIVSYLRRYADFVDVEVREGVAVQRLMPHGSGYRLITSDGELLADQVVVATGGYHTPQRHGDAPRLPASIVQLDAVLVVGSGQSGCQIAEDLFLAGREVHLSVGSAPRSPRRYRGRDVVDWLDRMGYYAHPISDHPDPRSVRAKTNHYLTGRDGGREIDLRARALQGMHLHGRLCSLSADQILFQDDLAANLDQADAVYCRIRASIDAWIANNNLDVPDEPPYTPCWQPGPSPDLGLDLTAQPLAAVIWCTGYRADFRWIDVPVFDGSGIPAHDRGITQSPGLYFLGLPWLHTWGSGRFCGVAEDADYLADLISLRLRRRDASQERLECTALLGS
jgi:putative flavoprotein involved in K+ transport